jgi:serine/threonine-protein kinase SRPK3
MTSVSKEDDNTKKIFTKSENEEDDCYSSSAAGTINSYNDVDSSDDYDSQSSHSSLSTNDYTDSIESEENPFYGKILDKNYFVIVKLGSGSFSSVWLSYSLKHDTLVAIKISNEEDCEEAMKEYDFITNNKIPNTINFIDKFSILINYEADSENSESEVAEQVCIVMPLMICTAYDLLKLNDKQGIDPRLVKQLVNQVGKSIKTIHDLNYIHTDIKPENILVKSINGKSALKINNKFNKLHGEIKKLDLKNKLINVTDETKLEQINQVLIDYYEGLDDESINQDILTDTTNIEFILIDFGSIKINNKEHTSIQQTRYYRAPELLLRYKWDEKIDLWSFGCVVYELLTGNILVDPDKDEQNDRNTYHINYCETVSNSRNEPKKYFDSAFSYSKYYNANGFLINKICDSEVENLMKDEKIYKDNELYKLITNCVQFNPSKRTMYICGTV